MRTPKAKDTGSRIVSVLLAYRALLESMGDVQATPGLKALYGFQMGIGHPGLRYAGDLNALYEENNVTDNAFAAYGRTRIVANILLTVPWVCALLRRQSKQVTYLGNQIGEGTEKTYRVFFPSPSSITSLKLVADEFPKRMIPVGRHSVKDNGVSMGIGMKLDAAAASFRADHHLIQTGESSHGDMTETLCQLITQIAEDLRESSSFSPAQWKTIYLPFFQVLTSVLHLYYPTTKVGREIFPYKEVVTAVVLSDSTLAALPLTEPRWYAFFQDREVCNATSVKGLSLLTTLAQNI